MSRVLMFSHHDASLPTGASVRLRRVMTDLQTLGFEIHFAHISLGENRNSTEHSPTSCRNCRSYHRLSLRGQRLQGPLSNAIREATRQRSFLLKVRDLASGAAFKTRRQINRLLAQITPQVIWIDHTHLAPLIGHLSPNPGQLRIVDTNDVMSARDESFRRMGMPPDFGLSRRDERELLLLFDQVIAIQPQEQALLRQLVPERNVTLLEHSLDLVPQPSLRPSVCFVGSNYVTNIHGITRFVESAWTDIRRRVPEATLEIVGKITESPAIQELAMKDRGIVLRGFVPEVVDIYRGPRVFISPLWAGSGLKIKMVEALGHGKAVVATPVSAQGLEAGVGEAFLSVCEPEEFVEPVCRLLSDPQVRFHYERKAFEFACRRFDIHQGQRHLRQLLSKAA